jgi:hypothetical protein
VHDNLRGKMHDNLRGKSMARERQEHGKSVARAWPERGRSMEASASTPGVHGKRHGDSKHNGMATRSTRLLTAWHVSPSC